MNTTEEKELKTVTVWHRHLSPPRKSSEGTIDDQGQWHGKRTFWGKGGRITEVDEYHHGTKVSWTIFFEDSVLEEKYGLDGSVTRTERKLI